MGLRSTLEATRHAWLTLGLAGAAAGILLAPADLGGAAVSPWVAFLVHGFPGIWLLGLVQALAHEASRPHASASAMDRTLAWLLYPLLAGPVPALVLFLLGHRIFVGGSVSFDADAEVLTAFARWFVQPVLLAVLISATLVLRRRGTRLDRRWAGGSLAVGAAAAIVWEAMVRSPTLEVHGGFWFGLGGFMAACLYVRRLYHPYAPRPRSGPLPLPYAPEREG
jgi:hypothetical protein